MTFQRDPLPMEKAMSGDRPDGDAAAMSREGFIELEAHAGRDTGRGTGTQPATSDELVSFWQEAGRPLWFTKDEAFDRCFRRRFLLAHEAASRGECDGWLETPRGALGLILLLDQFPRNAFRGTPRMYASDALARIATNLAIAAGHDVQVSRRLRPFVYMPLCHSEDLADQERAVELMRRIDETYVPHAMRHRDIIARFGRFPHRNPILGRTMTTEEQDFLDQGGFAG
jgi:uncharacterized protein (DUF924 family)